MLNVGLNVNYNDGRATIVGGGDIGSDPAVTLDLDNSKVYVTPWYNKYDKACETYITFKLVYDADGNEYNRWITLIVDSSGNARILSSYLRTSSVSSSVTITTIPCNGEIPEFPTVAIPIAAILGLAFFFQRRKE